MKIERWLIYTVSVAALPFFIRLMCYLMLNNPVGSAVSPIDIVFFGLTLNISNINELNILKNKCKRTDSTITPPNKDRIFGLSLLLVIFLTITLGMIYSSGLLAVQSINLESAYICSILMSIASFIFSWNVMMKIQCYYGNN